MLFLAVSGTFTNDTGGGMSLIVLGFLGGREGSTNFPFPLPSTGGGKLGAWAVGSFMDNAFCVGILGTAGSLRVASSSAGGVFLFLSSPVFFLARLLVFLASSDNRGMVSAKPMDNMLNDDSMKDAVNEITRYKGMCKMN